MPTTIITAENIPALLATALQRIDRLEAELSARDQQIAEQAIQIEQLRDQDRVQAAAFKAAQTQLPATIRAIAGSGNARGAGDGGQGDGDGQGAGNPRGSGRRDARGRSGAAGGDGGTRSSGSGGGAGAGSSGGGGSRAGNDNPRGRLRAATPPPEEPAGPRKKAHRWI